jgi:hypothetical protein
MQQHDLAEMANPESVVENVTRNAAAFRQAAHDHGEPQANVREASYRGHRITLHTTYRIEVDGRPLPIPVHVGNNGQIHYHGLPNFVFSSMIDLVERVIDAFPSDFDSSDGSPTPHTHEEEG